MNWKLARAENGRPEIDVFSDADPAWGSTVLEEMAKHDPSMQKVADGVWMYKKHLWEREL
jgi:hypothetical protein